MPIHNHLVLPTLMLALAGSGCVAHATGSSSFEAHADAEASGPELVLVSPDIWVVEDYDEAVFFYADAYWTSRGNVWYRSEMYDRGWVRVTVVPTVIVHITRPEAYVRYRGPKHAARRGHKHREREYAHDKPEPRRDEVRDDGRSDDQHHAHHPKKHDDKYEKGHKHGKKGHDHGKKHDKYGKKEDKYGKKEDKYGKKHDEHGKKEDRYAKKEHERAGHEDHDHRGRDSRR